MKSIKKRTPSKNIWKIAIPIAAIVLIGSAFAYALMQNTSDQSVEPAPEQLSEEDANAKEEFVKDNSDSIKDDTANSGRGGVVEDSSVRLDASQNENEVVIQTKLYDVSSGKCSLSVENDSTTIERESEIIYQAEYSTCAGFSIDKGDLGSGTWNIDLRINDGTTSKVGSTELEVR